MSRLMRWGLKLLMVLLALSGFAVGADRDPGPGSERGLHIDAVSAGPAWQSLSQAMNPPLAAAAVLLGDASPTAGAPAAASTQQLRAADEAVLPCESSAGLLLLACLLGSLLRRRRAQRPA